MRQRIGPEAAVEGGGQAFAPLRRAALGLDQRRHAGAPVLRFLAAAESAQIGERAHDLGELQELIGTLKAEIARVQQMLADKQSSKSAAEQVFKR